MDPVTANANKTWEAAAEHKYDQLQLAVSAKIGTQDKNKTICMP